jgi:hypothetical protein
MACPPKESLWHCVPLLLVSVPAYHIDWKIGAKFDYKLTPDLKLEYKRDK